MKPTVRVSLSEKLEKMLAEPVHCGGCSDCCRGVQIELQEGDDVAAYDHVKNAQGKAYLRRVEGDCVYVSKWGCQIYESRPRACRDFDCRHVALAAKEGDLTNDWDRLVHMRGVIRIRTFLGGGG